MVTTCVFIVFGNGKKVYHEIKFSSLPRKGDILDISTFRNCQVTQVKHRVLNKPVNLDSRNNTYFSNGVDIITSPYKSHDEPSESENENDQIISLRDRGWKII